MFFYKQLYRHGFLNASQQTATCCKQSNNLKAHVSTVIYKHHWRGEKNQTGLSRIAVRRNHQRRDEKRKKKS